MAILFITGPPAALPGLLTIPDYRPDHHDRQELPDGRLRISAHLPESTVPAIEALGLTVEVEVTDAEWDAHMATFRDDGPPIG